MVGNKLLEQLYRLLRRLRKTSRVRLSYFVSDLSPFSSIEIVIANQLNNSKVTLQFLITPDENKID